MGEYRLVRLGEQLRDEISQLILRQRIKDPRVSTFLNVNRVEVAGDLSRTQSSARGSIAVLSRQASVLDLPPLTHSSASL